MADDSGEGAQKGAVGGFSLKAAAEAVFAVLAAVVVWSVLTASCQKAGGTTSPIGKAACGASSALQWAGSHMGAVVALVAIAVAGPALAGLAGVVKAVGGSKGSSDDANDDGGDDGEGGEGEGGGGEIEI